MSCASGRAKALLLACAALQGCQDPARAPIPLAITSDPPAQTAGGVITLTSDQFPGLRLIPSPDTLRPNRWSNFAVIVNDDTAESWRVGPTEIAFRVPAVYTGNYEAVIDAEGYDEARVAFFGVGLAYPMYWGGLNGYTDVSSGTLLPGRGLLVAEGSPWPGFFTGYGLIDVLSRQLSMPGPLRRADSNRVKMYVPGPSYRADHYVMDLSPPGVAAAMVWRPDPWRIVDSIPCGDPGGNYTAAELSATTCLSLRFGVLVRNGTDTLIPNFYSAPSGEFRLAPGGKWAVLRTELASRDSREEAMSWPVLDQTGAVAYTIDTLFHVTGAAFSSTGDTMFLTTSVRDTAALNLQGGRFSISLYETATGRFLTARAFPPTRALQDVALDPVRPLLYVGGIDWEGVWPDGAFREYLTVLDRRTLEIVADMPVPAIPYHSAVSDATLVYQAGRVSVVGWCGFDCGGLYVFTFDLP